MRGRLVGKVYVRAVSTGAIVVVALAAYAFVAARAVGGDVTNTGMADPVALVSAFDRFAAGGAPANDRDPVALQSSRREQRGCERRRTGRWSISRQARWTPPSNYFRLTARSTSG